MDKEVVPTPVRYRDVSTTMSRPTFSKHHAKIIGDVYLHRDVADQPDKITDALLTRHPQGVLRGFSALRNMGFTLNLDDWTPMISVPRQSASPRVYSGRVLRLVEKDVVTINGRRSVSAVQAVVDVLTWPDSWGQWRDGTRTEEQVALIDHLLRQDPDLLPGLTEDPRTRDVALLADHLAQSRPESIMRVRLHEAGLTDWKPQIRVRGRDDFYFVDLGDPVLHVGIDYLQAHHFDEYEQARDVQRANDLGWAGWIILRVTPDILGSEVEWRRFLGQVREELAVAREERDSQVPRAWQAGAPCIPVSPVLPDVPRCCGEW